MQVQKIVISRGIEARSELYLRFFDSSGTENRDLTGKNVFHGSIVDFTGLPHKQPISRTRDTVKKEGPCTTGDV